MPVLHKPQFKVAYRGETEYEIGGRTYGVRHWCSPADDGAYYQPGVYKREIEPKVGTIYCVYPGHGEFPPPEVVALFPGYVPSRWNRESNSIAYQGQRPRLTFEGLNVWATQSLEDMARLYQVAPKGSVRPEDVDHTANGFLPPPEEQPEEGPPVRKRRQRAQAQVEARPS